MKKSILVSFLSLVLVMNVLAGCSRGIEAEKANVQNENVSKDENVSKNEENVGDEIELTVWGWDASFNGIAMKEADQRYDGAKVNFVEMGKADCLQKIHTTLASGVTEDLPDIVIISDLAVQGYLMAYPNAFKPMDTVIDYSEFAKYKKDMLSYEGVGYGVPFDTGVAGLFYRTDYIEQAGYTDEQMQNLTWDDYLKLGERLAEKGVMLQTYNPNDISEFQIMLQSAGTWYTDESGKANFTENEALKESIDIFKQFNESNFVKIASDWTGFTGAINGGEVACVIRGSWIASVIKAAEDQSGLWKVAPIPKLNASGATNRSNQGGSSWFVLENSDNAEVAADFLKNTFASNEELYEVLLADKNIMGTYLPASDSPAYDSEDAFFSNMKVNKALTTWLSEIPAVDTGVYTAEAQAAILAVMPGILNGDDVDAALETAENQFSQMVQE